jgi:Cas6b C-terminal domain/Cas6b N-terminal domain
VKILTATFDIPLHPSQLTQWRGALAQYAGWADDQFHNHDGAKNKFHYRYANICYRCSDGKAALFAIGDGVEAIQDMFLRSAGNIRIGNQILPLNQLDYRQNVYIPNMPDEPQKYFLKNWLALNDHNFKNYLHAPSLAERTLILERILASNIIAFAKAIDWRLPKPLVVTLLQIRNTHTLKHKNASLIAFDISFSANIDLPEGLGLGKSISHGHGITTHLIEPIPNKIKRPRTQSKLQVIK